MTATALLLACATQALAHDVTPGDAGYIQEIWGVHVIPFIYLGAKHMITGYDHILFLLGVVFFLYRMKDVAIHVSLFALGHARGNLRAACRPGGAKLASGAIRRQTDPGS